MRMTVFGGGSWGTALAHLMAAKGLEVTLLVRDDAQAEAINLRHENPRYLPGLSLAPSLRADTNAETALAGADVCLLAVPCQFLRHALNEAASFIPEHSVPVCASKGIETGTLKRMSEVVADVLPEWSRNYAILSGPSFAKEVVEGKPAAVVLGCADAALGERLLGQPLVLRLDVDRGQHAVVAHAGQQPQSADTHAGAHLHHGFAAG